MIVATGAGSLAPFNEAGVLDASDVHVAHRVAALAGVAVSDAVLLGTALAVRAVRSGSTCVELESVAALADEHRAAAARDQSGGDDESAGDGTGGDVTAGDALPWPSAGDLIAQLRASPLVTGAPTGPLRPLAMAQSADGTLLYLRKYFRQEQSIRSILEARSSTRPDVDGAALTAALDGAFAPADGYDRQRAAAALAASTWTTVLAGGPGTGKTYTVARILAVMETVLGDDIRIGLCAPTGRAAAQLQSAIGEYSRRNRRLRSEPTAVTVHRLLGSRPDGTFVRGAGNRLPYDVVVVDETSMLPVTLMCRLLESLRSDTRLILVGDPHQLVSVEAGAVLADLVERDPTETVDAGLPEAFATAARLAESDFTGDERAMLGAGVVTLRRGHRYGDRIGEVAEAVNAGDADRVLRLVDGSDPDRPVTLVDPDALDGVREAVVHWARDLRRTALDGDAHAAVRALRGHRVLCAHRDGQFGVAGWSRRITGWIGEDGGAPATGSVWYAGEPLLVTANDRAQDVYNGDSGVVIADGPSLAAVFERGDQIKRLHPSQLADAVPVYAMTIHRSQGSQFEEVTVVLPPAGAELLTRELLYTAITRAEKRVRIVGTPEALAAAVGRRVARASGLRSRLTEI